MTAVPNPPTDSRRRTHVTEQPRPSDGERGCPVITWDGPYRMRCNLGAAVGRCAYHGPFEQPAEPRADTDRQAHEETP